VNVDVINTFEAAFPLLKDGGIYIVEDTICHKWRKSVKEEAPDHLSYFVRYTTYLNQWRMSDSVSGPRDNCTDPFKIIKKTSDPIEQGLDKMEFGSSYIALYKKVRTHWIP
jgi:hypothetical protein